MAESALFSLTRAASEHREPVGQRLQDLAEVVCHAPVSEFPRYTEELRVMLQECGAEASAYISRLEQECSGMKRAIADFAGSLDGSDDGSEQAIRLTVDRLRALARSPEARPLRDALRSAADSVERNFDRLQKQHRLASTNLQREIHSLQQSRSLPREYPVPGIETALADRSALEARLCGIRPGLFRIVLLRLRGLRMVLNQPEAEAGTQILSLLAARARNTFPIRTLLGRWSQEEFVALVPSADAGVSPKAFCRDVLDGLYDPWVFTVGGRTFRPAIDVSACVLDTSAHETASQLLEKIDTSLQRM